MRKKVSGLILCFALYIDWSFEEKARRCGIHDTDSGYEICFGISNYGQNRYAIEY